MSTLVECVPNFSEGRDPAKIRQITDAIEAAGGKVLNVEPGIDTHRTVVTFVGSVEQVEAAAFAGIAKAAQLIDMNQHAGAHPRMGATDVCPFVPVEGVTMAECVQIARRVGERVGRELGIPVYLYEEAATQPQRKSLSVVRKGEYEGLAAKLADPAWAPDFGPSTPHPTAGAMVIGAREFLIAYNINLNSTDKMHASDLAFALREKGRVGRSGNTVPFYARGKKLFYRDGSFPCGSCARVETSYDAIRAHCATDHGYDLDALLRANDRTPPNVVGSEVFRPGLFTDCKAIGWYVEDYQRAQVSINLTNYRKTPPHAVFDAASRLAEERGLRVTGSEIVGLVPFAALLESGRYYLDKQGRSPGQPLGDVLRVAAQSLGLSDAAPFDIDKKVLGLPRRKEGVLVDKTVVEFADEVSRDSPAPGGGSVAALAGALGAALAGMVANLTYGKEGTEARDPELARISAEAQRVKDQLLAAVDADADAFGEYMTALRMPKATAEEKAVRAERMQQGLKSAVRVPHASAAACLEAMRLARAVIDIGITASLSDGAVGTQLGYAGVRGSVWNVLINLKDIKDAAFVAEERSACSALLVEAGRLADEAARVVDQRLLAAG